MISCLYKKTFLKDLAKLPLAYRGRIEKLVFEDIPEFEDIFKALDIKKMKGYRGYYRIRVGSYRIGCRIENNHKTIFYRVKSREDIYKIFS
jgi:Cytotoxic translational repressor of toxin-antitoxin stability system